MNELIQSLKRHTIPSALNLLGLAVALAACYVLWTQVEYARNFNKCITDWEDVYRIETSLSYDEKWGATIPLPLVSELKKRADVDEVFITDLYREKRTQIEVDGTKQTAQIAMTNRRALGAIRPKMLCGVDTLANEREVIMPASEAERLFGNKMAMGKTFLWYKETVTVVGVYEDMPSNCLIGNTLYASFGKLDIDNYLNWNYLSLVRLRKGTDPSVVEDYASKVMTKCIEDDTKFTCTVRLRPVAETYSSGIEASMDKGNPMMLSIITYAIWLLLIVAAINFANFTLAETPMKIRGINTRKVLGMTNWQLRLDLILETVVISLIALIIALALCWLLSLAPWMSNMVATSIALKVNLHIILYIGVAAVVIGVLVGVYPAFYATSFQPAMVLKGNYGLSPSGVLLRKTLVFVQMFIALVMAVYLGVLLMQSHYIHNSDYGFAKDEIMFSWFEIDENNVEKYRDELEKIPGVESVGVAGYVPGISKSATRMTREQDGVIMNIVLNPCDWKFLRTIGIDIVEGNDFGPKDTDCYIVNETAMRKYNWIGVDKPLTKDDCPVIGVCRNYRLFTTREDNANEAAAFLVMGDKFSSWRLNFKVFVRIGKNIDKIETKKKIEACAAKLANKEDGDLSPEFRFMDEQLQQSYEEEFRFISQVEAFSIICLVVTLVGVFCLTMFETEYRRREIGLRRVMGTSRREILRRFIAAQLVLLIPAFLLAAPLAWLMSQDWLSNFAERAAIPLWLPLAALAIIATLVLATVAAMTWRALRLKPVEAIKQE